MVPAKTGAIPAKQSEEASSDTNVFFILIVGLGWIQSDRMSDGCSIAKMHSELTYDQCS